MISFVSRYSYFLVPFMALEAVGYAADVYGDDSPGFAIGVIGPAFLLALGAWLGLWLHAAFVRGSRQAISCAVAPLVAIAAVATLSRVGFPPWRIAFELERPYYLLQAFDAKPDATGIRRISFLQDDRELWSGHAKREFFYDSEAAPLPKNSRAPVELGGGCVWTEYTNQHFGFYSRQAISSYVEACAPAE